MNLTLQPVLVPSGEGGEARLVFYRGWLVAVLVQLSALHEDHAGWWFLEKGFDRLDRPNSPVFPDLEAAATWIAAHLADSPKFQGLGAPPDKA